MRKMRRYEPDQNFLINFDSEKHFPAGSYERFLVETLNTVNIDMFYGIDESPGEVPIDPRAMLGIIFYSITRGDFRSRTIEENCKNHFGYMYLSGFNTPDHSTICRFINKFRDQIKNIFIQILYLAISKNYIDLDVLATDGTKIKASASSEFTGTLDDFKKRIKKLDKKIEELIEKQENAASEIEKAKLEEKEEKQKKERDKIAVFLESAQKVLTKRNCETKQNITDQDARIMKTNGAYTESYNAQAMGDSKHGLIVASMVTNDVNDYENMSKMINELESNMADNEESDTSKTKHVMDNGYYSTENLVYAKKNGLDVYIADAKDKRVYNNENAADAEKDQKITIHSCAIETQNESYVLICPGQKQIPLLGKTKSSDRAVDYIFQTKNEGECVSCKYKKKCIDTRKRKDFKIKKLKLDEMQIVDEHRSKLRSVEGLEIYSHRMPTIEKCFAFIKELCRYRKTHRRGIEKIGIEWDLICASHNLRRMYSLSRVKE